MMTPKFNEVVKHNTERSESVVESDVSFLNLMGQVCFFLFEKVMGQVCDAAWDCSDWRVTFTYGFEFFFYFFLFYNHIVLNLLYF